MAQGESPIVCLCDAVPRRAVTAGAADVPESIHRIEKLLNASVEFHELDLLDKAGLEALFQKVRKPLDSSVPPREGGGTDVAPHPFSEALPTCRCSIPSAR